MQLLAERSMVTDTHVSCMFVLSCPQCAADLQVRQLKACPQKAPQAAAEVAAAAAQDAAAVKRAAAAAARAQRAREEAAGPFIVCDSKMRKLKEVRACRRR